MDVASYIHIECLVDELHGDVIKQIQLTHTSRHKRS